MSGPRATATQPRCAAIIVAAGRAARSDGIDRSLALLGGRSVITWSLEAFQSHDRIHDIVLVVPAPDTPTYSWLAVKHGITKLSRVVGTLGAGQENLLSGLRALTRADIVVIHDGANPFVSREEISAVVLGALEAGAAAVGEPCEGPLRKVGEDMLCDGVIARSDVWCMQTPQALRYELALAAYQRALEDGFHGCDVLQLVEHLGRKPRVLRTSARRVAIGTAADLELAEALLRCRAERAHV
jgi:2-C-methyl-D-erythritol 4-phosphate cytidylyltransferase